MDLDLERLGTLHVMLPRADAESLRLRAAVALARSGHQPGVTLTCKIHHSGAEVTASLSWEPRDPTAADQIDRYRITEDGAEAVALIVAGDILKWVTVRRMQRGENADWLLRDDAGGTVAFEISGTEGNFDPRRLVQKVGQVAGASGWSLRAACVVAFADVRAEVASP